MKKTYFLKTMLLAMVMLLGSVGAKAADTFVITNSIAVGDQVVLVNTAAKKELGSITTSGTTYGVGVAFTTSPAGEMVLDVVAGTSAGTFAFKNGNNYLYHPGTKSNSLGVNTTLDSKTSWNVTFDGSNNASITNVATPTRKLQWNSGSPRFACYTTAQTDVQLYKKVVATTGVPAPEFSVPAGNYTEAFKVGIAPYGTDTVVRYTLDGTTPVATSAIYTDSIDITTTTTLNAIACTATDTSTVTTATYAFPAEVADIAAFLAANTATNTTEYKITGTVTVTYFNGKYLYVQDASGAIVIYDAAGIEGTYTNGQTLTGLRGTYTLYNGLNELVPTYLPTAVAGTTVLPTVKTIDQLTTASQNQYIKLEGVKFSEDADYTAGTAGTSYEFTDDVNSVDYYNSTFRLLDGSYLASKTYDVVCLASVHNTTVQVLPISATEVASTEPAIYVTDVTDNAIDFGEKTINGSYTETFTVSGVNLTDDIEFLMYDGGHGFTVSPASITPVAGTVAETTVTVTYAPVAAGASTDILNIASTGVTDIDIDLTGTGILPTLATPVATDATNVNNNSFMANWDAVTNATSYQVNVWTGSDLFSETFDDITTGNSTSTSGSSTTWTINANFSAGNTVYQAGGAIKLGSGSAVGSITTKALDLSQGAVLTFDVKGWTTVEGDIKVSVTGLADQTVTYTAAMADEFETKTLTLGAASATATITIATTAKRAFIDNIVVASKTAVAGSPFAATTNSLAITGLDANTTYSYNVVANAEGYNSSEASNTISVTTTNTNTGICQQPTIEGVSFNGTMLRNNAGLTLRVYNSVGTLVMVSNEAVVDMNTLPSGMYIVRSANASLKVVK